MKTFIHAMVVFEHLLVSDIVLDNENTTACKADIVPALLELIFCYGETYYKHVMDKENNFEEQLVL